MTKPLTLLLALMLLGAACAETAQPLEEASSPDAENAEALIPGKADESGYSWCELDHVVAWVNLATTDYEELRAGGVHGAAARRIPAYRNGPDGISGTDDDNRFDDIYEVDAVPYVGPVALSQLVAKVADQCVVTASAEVIFSPQPWHESHLARVVEMIEAAERSIDIAMYSMSDGGVIDSIIEAAERGVSIRLLFEAANGDRSDPEGSRSARFEAAGIEVRWINKIMHHKFALFDGPREAIIDGDPGALITGSANWSYSAGTRYDENTIIVRDNAEAVARFQAEFNHLWAHSRDFVWNEDIVHLESIAIAAEDVEDDPNFDAVFTSENFRTYHSSRFGETFTVIRGESAVSDRLVDMILSAEDSIWVASGHLRSRPVSEALLAAHDANPALDIRIYLDGQEYVSASGHARQERLLVECLEAAGDSESRAQDCVDRGFRFGYALHLAGIDVRYKYYAYRWDYTYAPQMHHKYLIVDGTLLATGSYNLSDNAEHNTMENMVFYSADGYPELVASFERNFESLWTTHEGDGTYDSLLDEIKDGDGDIPIVFEAMALDWAQIAVLKEAIRTACPDVVSEEYRTNARDYRSCPRP